MSMVQISSSNVLGTLASSSSGTIPLIHRDTRPHARVCRNLFGPVDHEELSREMEAKLREIAERDRRRWNFDFGAGEPLLGDYEWEEAPRDASPTFYQEYARAAKTKAAQLPEDADSEQTVDAKIKKRWSSLNSSSAELRGRTTPRKRASPLTTTRITDFYVKRRNGTEQRPEGSTRKPFPLVAEEQTPRKRLR